MTAIIGLVLIATMSVAGIAAAVALVIKFNSWLKFWSQN